MIFLTVGSHEPFDRLVSAVDGWAKRQGRDDVFAQIGPTGLEPSHITWTRALSPAEYRRHAAEADLIVSHAGMGTILAALDVGTPILVMPRFARLGETRNEHQSDTVRHLRDQIALPVAADEKELCERLDRLDELLSAPLAGAGAVEELVDAIRGFIADG